MSPNTTIAVPFLAALLEAGGDALIRAGLHKTPPWQKASLFAVAALVLFACGCTVNSPPWDFDKLLGLYVVFFFLTAQAISRLAFKQLPSLAVLVGGRFILTGGIIIATASM
jgi:small multidrug resistance family-3 protein